MIGHFAFLQIRVSLCDIWADRRPDHLRHRVGHHRQHRHQRLGRKKRFSRLAKLFGWCRQIKLTLRRNGSWIIPSQRIWKGFVSWPWRFLLKRRPQESRLQQHWAHFLQTKCGLHWKLLSSPLKIGSWPRCWIKKQFLGRKTKTFGLFVQQFLIMGSYYLCIINPWFLGDSENFIPANPLVTLNSNFCMFKFSSPSR